MFVKRGGDSDGKIVSVIKEEELTETQKKKVKDLSKEAVGQQDKNSDLSKSGS